MPLMVADNYGPEQRLLNGPFLRCNRHSPYRLRAGRRVWRRAGGPRVRPHVLQCLARCLGRMSPNNWSSVAEWGFRRFRFAAPTSLRQRCAAKGLLPRQHVDGAPSDTSSCTASTTSRRRGGEFASSDRTPSSITVRRSRESPGSGDALSPALAATLAVVARERC